MEGFDTTQVQGAEQFPRNTVQRLEKIRRKKHPFQDKPKAHRHRQAQT